MVTLDQIEAAQDRGEPCPCAWCNSRSMNIHKRPERHSDTAKIAARLRAAIHMESAALSPHTTPLIETAKEAADALETLDADL